MNRILRTLTTAVVTVAVATAGLAATTTGASQGATASRATPSGEIGGYSFPDKQGQIPATCVYSKGRLVAIPLIAPSASGRSEWGSVGQWIRWGAQLQAKAAHGGWRTVGATNFSDAQPRTSSMGGPLPDTSIPHIAGAPGTQYRVTETITWYLSNTSQQLVQGKAAIVVQHYSSRGKAATSCEGVARAKRPRLKSVSNDELDTVHVSFAGRSHGASIKYSLKGGALPAGLTLNKKTGAVTGTILATASSATAAAATASTSPAPSELAYLNIKPQTFHFDLAAKANGRTTTKGYKWVVYDTAFVMPSYYGLYGCGQRCQGNTEPVLNISDLGPKFAFGCTTTPQPGIPADKYSVIYQQEYQMDDGAMASSAGATLVYGDVFKWWYYNNAC